MPTPSHLSWVRYYVPAMLTIVAGAACFVLATDRVKDDTRALLRQQLRCLPVPPTPTPTLLTLPRELRDQIFRYLLVPADNADNDDDDDADIALSRWNHQPLTNPDIERSYRTLRLTNFLVREEAEDMFFSQNKFVLDIIETGDRGFLLSWPKVSRQKGIRYDTTAVRNLKLRRTERMSYADAFLFGKRDWK